MDKPAAIPEFLSGGGELGQRIREFDWASTPLGPVDTWPQSLRTCIRIMLTSRQPIWIGWGKELIKLYNDPYKAIVGGKHPWALGTPASIVWKDIWRDIEPMLRQVMEKDEGTYVESQLLIMERNGYPEETYYTFSYTPIPGDAGSTAGMICANTDDTDRIISERQLRTLTQLGKALTDSKSNEEVIRQTIDTIKENQYDFPFALFYSIQDDQAILSRATDLGDTYDVIPKSIDLEAANEISLLLKQAITERKLQVFEELVTKLGAMPKGAWEVSPDKAIILPIVQAGAKEPYGFLVVGLNPYRLLDEKYRSFFSLVSDQVATSFTNVHALEEERKRVEALAEIDRAKTTFFSNISHEFRTPLTLLLGPIEDALNHSGISATERSRLELAHRNALRMQKLVNTLLDFSRIEAGRVEGSFSKVDVCTFTQDLVSTFRSAIEKAGMQLEFECGEIRQDVYVDMEMWEKIVLNLISNAFKYTKQGKITVRITGENGYLLLAVSDTGVGIAEDQLNKIFERFHRVENTSGRSQEGTGIGLAMVKELVRLHKGAITVDSQPGVGTTFTVSIPTGKEHLPANKIVDHAQQEVSPQSLIFLQEAMKWLPADDTNAQQVSNNGDTPNAETFASPRLRFKVLLADDNADMREYVQRLLAPQFNVTTAVNGEEAFEKCLELKPDLLLSDVMMPVLDGFGLLKKIRNHPDTKNIPVIFLSARAGEEAKIEGFEAGADDYLVKPFAAKELLARVESNIRIAKSRMAAELNLKNVIAQSPVAMTILRGEQMVVEIANDRALEIWGRTREETINHPVWEVLPEVAAQGFDKILQRVYETGEPFKANEVPVTIIRNGKPETLYISFVYEPLRNTFGVIDGLLGAGFDITPQVTARKKIEQSEAELAELANAMPQLVWVANAEGDVLYYNERVSEFDGAKRHEGNWLWQGMVHPEDSALTEQAWRHSVETGTTYQVEHRIKKSSGVYHWHLSRAVPHRDDEGKIVKWFGTATDIHAAKEQSNILEEEVRKRTRQLNELNTSLQQSNNDLQQFAHVASHDLKEPLRKIKIFSGRLADDPATSFSDKAKVYIEKVNSAVERMYMMVEGVLNYSMVNSTWQAMETVDLNAVFGHIESDLELLIHQKSASLSYKDLPSIQGAAVLIYQLFYNLVNNSLKFSRKGVPLRITISSNIIHKGNRPYAEVSVQDNGIGFEQHQAERIFNTFERLNSKDQYEGTGLGLALCKRIVQRHGGTIQAIGRDNEGATFIVQLPLVQERGSI